MPGRLLHIAPPIPRCGFIPIGLVVSLPRIANHTQGDFRAVLNKITESAAAIAINALQTACDLAVVDHHRGAMAVVRVADLLGRHHVACDPRLDTREGTYEVASDLSILVAAASAGVAV